MGPTDTVGGPETPSPSHSTSNVTSLSVGLEIDSCGVRSLSIYFQVYPFALIDIMAHETNNVDEKIFTFNLI